MYFVDNKGVGTCLLTLKVLKSIVLKIENIVPDG